MKTWKSLLLFLCATFAVASIGAVAPPDAWFAALNKPAFNPPSWVFAPVWTLLYVLMAVAAWRVYVRRSFDRALVCWCVQLALNAVWSPIFFRWHDLFAAVVDIVALLIAILITTLLFWRRDRIAAGLMLPYVLWVGFATVLAVTIWRINTA